MKSWIKGGLIGVLVLIILVIIFGSLLAITNNGSCDFMGAEGIKTCYLLHYRILTFPTVYLGIIMARSFYSSGVGEPAPTTMSTLMIVLFSYVGGVLLWFAAGALISWVVGKIRKK